MIIRVNAKEIAAAAEGCEWLDIEIPDSEAIDEDIPEEMKRQGKEFLTLKEEMQDAGVDVSFIGRGEHDEAETTIPKAKTLGLNQPHECSWFEYKAPF